MGVGVGVGINGLRVKAYKATQGVSLEFGVSRGMIEAG